MRLRGVAKGALPGGLVMFELDGNINQRKTIRANTNGVAKVTWRVQAGRHTIGIVEPLCDPVLLVEVEVVDQ